MGSNHERNWRSKISWHTPFKKYTHWDNVHLTEKGYKLLAHSIITEVKLLRVASHPVHPQQQPAGATTWARNSTHGAVSCALQDLGEQHPTSTSNSAGEAHSATTPNPKIRWRNVQRTPQGWSTTHYCNLRPQKQTFTATHPSRHLYHHSDIRSAQINHFVLSKGKKK